MRKKEVRRQRSEGSDYQMNKKKMKQMNKMKEINIKNDINDTNAQNELNGATSTLFFHL